MLKKFLMWALHKVDKLAVARCTIGKTIDLNLTKFIPDDGQWHQVAFTLTYWVKVKDTEQPEARHLYVDGESMWDDIRLTEGEHKP